MQITSHFTGIQLNSEKFSDLFVKLSQYLQENKIEDILIFQNILSIHITLYYFEANLSKSDYEEIENFIKNLDFDFEIKIGNFNYFEIGDKKLICYLEIESQKKLKEYFKKFDRKFKIKEISENNLKFVPHITLFRIKNASIYEEHKVKIENIILEELERIKEKNISIGKCYLYKVNSKFAGEIQIKKRLSDA